MAHRPRLPNGRFAPDEAQLNGGITEEDFDAAYAEANASSSNNDDMNGMPADTPIPTTIPNKTWNADARINGIHAEEIGEREKCFRELRDLEEKVSSTAKQLFGGRTGEDVRDYAGGMTGMKMVLEEFGEGMEGLVSTDALGIILSGISVHKLQGDLYPQ